MTKVISKNRTSNIVSDIRNINDDVLGHVEIEGWFCYHVIEFREE